MYDDIVNTLNSLVGRFIMQSYTFEFLFYSVFCIQMTRQQTICFNIAAFWLRVNIFFMAVNSIVAFSSGLFSTFDITNYLVCMQQTNNFWLPVKRLNNVMSTTAPNIICVCVYACKCEFIDTLPPPELSIHSNDKCENIILDCMKKFLNKIIIHNFKINKYILAKHFECHYKWRKNNNNHG